MEITVSEAAIKWFKEEVGLTEGDMVKFYSQIYGNSPVQENFALAFTIDNEPVDMEVKAEVAGIVFYVEERDIWFFSGHNLHVDFNERKDELEYSYSK